MEMLDFNDYEDYLKYEQKIKNEKLAKTSMLIV